MKKVRYIAKSETWFDAGTVAELIDNYRPDANCGLFRGYRNGKLDEETCPFNEFDKEESKNDV